MKKRLIITLLICLTIAYSCEEPMEINAGGQKVTLEEIDPLLDDHLMNLLPSVANGNITNGRSLESELGEIDLSKAIKVVNPFDTITRYTLRFMDESLLGFENLIIKESNQGVTSYILRYEPDVDWLTEHAGVFENRSFTGRLIIKNMSRSNIAESVFENGRGVDNSYFQDPNGRTNCDDASGGGGSGGGGGGGGGEGGGEGGGGGEGEGGGGSGGGTSDGGSGGSGGGSGSSGEPCDWWISEITGGLVIDCPGMALIFVLRTACDPIGLPDYKQCQDYSIPLDEHCPEDPIGILPQDGWAPDIILNAPPQGDVITDIAAYLKCFDLSSGGKVTIYVDQPSPNSRSTWSGIALDPDVGHTFIGIEQGGTTRFFGFYPTDGVNPFTSPSDNSSLVDDGGHAYDVKIEIPVNSSQLTDVINLAKNRPSIYNLNSYNCTDFGIAVAIAAGISLQDTNGTWPGGGGSNPGDLGEDIRSSSFSSSVTVIKTSGTAPLNSGTCN
jgi:hypothetical protein